MLKRWGAGGPNFSRGEGPLTGGAAPCSNRLELRRDDRTAHILQELLLRRLLVVELTLMSLCVTVLRAEILLALTRESEQPQLLSARLHGTTRLLSHPDSGSEGRVPLEIRKGAQRVHNFRRLGGRLKQW